VSDFLSSLEYEYYCKYCEQVLDRDTEAHLCEDSNECPYTADWGGDACGYLVCNYCHRPVSERVK